LKAKIAVIAQLVMLSNTV